MRGHRANASLTMRFITRIGISWRVWVQAGALDCGQIYFSDRDYDGKKSSLVEAKLHRDAALIEHQVVLRKFDGNGYNLTHSKNTTGAVGVTLRLDVRNGRYGAYWSAAIMQDGKQVNIVRSIRRHGYQSSWTHVIKIREKHTGLKYPYSPPPPTDDLLEMARQWGVDKEFFKINGVNQ